MIAEDDLYQMRGDCAEADREAVEWWFDPHTYQELREQDQYAQIFHLNSDGSTECLGLPFKIVAGPVSTLDFVAPIPSLIEEITFETCLTLVAKRQNERLVYFNHKDNAEWAT